MTVLVIYTDQGEQCPSNEPEENPLFLIIFSNTKNNPSLFIFTSVVYRCIR